MPHDVRLNLDPIFSPWVIALIAMVLLLLLIQGSLILRRKNVPPRWVGILGGLRVVIVILIVICLLQPAVSMTRTTQHLPDLLVMIDTSQSMETKNVGSGKSRLEDAVATLKSGGLANELQKQFNVHYFSFDRSAYPLESADLAGLKAAGDSTRFADSLSTAWDYQRQAGSNDSAAPGASAAAPARALLVSDGGDLGADDVVETAHKLGVTIDTLSPGAVGVNQPAEKVVIATVQSPQRVLIGSETQIFVTLRADGAVKGPLTLALTEGAKPLAAQEVTFTPGQSEKQVRLAHRPTDVGVRQYELQLKNAAGAPAAPAYKFSVRVADNKKEVLVLEDTWRWEFKFLRRIFEDDPSFSFTAFLSRGSGMFAQYGEADRKVNLGGFPQSRSELEWFDMIVLGDVNPKRWPSTLAPAISKLVTEEGKSLVVIAGPNLANMADVPEIAQLLPVEITRESGSPIEGPVAVHLSREGASWPFFFNAPGNNLPPLDRIYPPLRKRPAATILLEASKQGNDYGNMIVVAEHTVGRGRVLFVGTDTLWKWQMQGPLNESSVTPYGLFWQQALRALAPAQSHTGGVSLTVQPDRSRYEAGRRVVLHATMKSDRPLPDATLQSTVSLPDGKQVPLAFAADPTKPNAYRAEFESTLAGQYKIAAAVNTQGKPAAEVLTAIDVEEPRAENSLTQIDEANLARIASATGGSKINLNDSKTWPVAAEQDRYPVEEAKTLDLWNNLTLMLVLCALLGVDWLLRLLRGFV